MSRYIERYKLINELQHLPEQERLEFMGVYDCVKTTPTADVVEVKRGEWKVDETHDYEPYCSLCGHEPIAGEKYNYCPDCGADMRG